MKLRNNITGQTLEIPPPNELGESALIIDGRVEERLLFSDVPGSPMVTTGSGEELVTSQEFAAWVKAKIARVEKEA